jgi:hypothetical protein
MVQGPTRVELELRRGDASATALRICQAARSSARVLSHSRPGEMKINHSIVMLIPRPVIMLILASVGAAVMRFTKVRLKPKRAPYRLSLIGETTTEGHMVD